MISISRSRLPVDETQLRAALATYLAALDAHKDTVGEPAPWPEYDVLRELAASGGDFVVVDDEADESKDLTKEQQDAIERKAIDAKREAALDAGVYLRDLTFGQELAKDEVPVIDRGPLYPSDDRFQAELLSMLLGYESGAFDAKSTQAVRTKDNKMVNLGLDDLRLLAVRIVKQRQAIHANAWTAKDALNVALT